MPFLTLKQAAEQFGITTHTLRTIAKSGQLPGCRRLGGRYYIAAEVLKRYFETAQPEQSTAGAA